jgi:hypothetical protein
MNLTIDDVSNLFTSQEKENNCKFYLGVVAEKHLDEGFYLCGVDASHEKVKATAFCNIEVGERVLLMVMPNGVCIALAGRIFSSDVNNTVAKEGDATVGNTNGNQLYAHYRIWNNGMLETWITSSEISYNITNAWGSAILEATSSFEASYVFTYAENPTVTYSFVPTNGYAILGIEVQNPNNYNPKYFSPKLTLTRPAGAGSSVTVTGYWNIYAVGKWDGVEW